MRATREPDQLAAEARRWLGRATLKTDPRIIAATLHALDRYYDDVAVVAGIVQWRRDNLAA